MKEKVIELLEDICLSSITDTALTLIDELAFDSLRMVMLLVLIEDTFDIELDESDMNPFVLITVQDVIDLVDRYTPKTEDEENG